MGIIGAPLRNLKRLLRNCVQSDRAKLRKKLQEEVEARFKPLFIDQPRSMCEIFEGVVASQTQQPPVLSLLIEAPERFFHAEALLPFLLLSSLVRQRSERWELLVYCQGLPSHLQNRLKLWVELLRRHTVSPIRLVGPVNGLNSWGSLLAWSSGSYLMAVTPNTWLDQDLVASLASWSKRLEASPEVITLDGLLHSQIDSSGSGSVGEILLGLEHDSWSLQSGWGIFPFLLNRRWVLQQHGLNAKPLDDPTIWQAVLMENGLLPKQFQGLFASVTQAQLLPIAPFQPQLRRPLPSYTAVVSMRCEMDEEDHQVHQLLDQMTRWSHPPGEVIIVGGYSKDGYTYSHTHEALFQVVHLSTLTNQSESTLSRAVPGIDAAKYDLILVIGESVTALGLNAAELLFAPYGESYNGITAPRVIDAESRLLHRGVMGGIMNGIGYPGFFSKPQGDSMDLIRAAESRLVSMVDCDVMVIPRFVWDQVGGLNSCYSEHFDVVDFCLRAGMLGHQTLYNGNAIFCNQGNSVPDTFPETRRDHDHLAFRSVWSEVLENDGFRHPLRSRETTREEPSTICREWIVRSWRSGHWLVIPVYDFPTEACLQRWLSWRLNGFNIILVDNSPSQRFNLPEELRASFLTISNHNLHRLAGGINRGMATTEASTAEVLTILDQDSCIDFDSLDDLRCKVLAHDHTIWGPMVYELDRRQLHAAPGVRAEWFLMTSGTTFRYHDWISIGPYNEQMEIDYLDHEWSARAVAQGYQLKCSKDALLLQTFGSKHPNRICRRLGMHLYSPLRHEAALRNLIWMLNDPRLPASFKLKESVKMLFKPFFWLLFEPQRYDNAKAIAFGLLHGLGLVSSVANPIKNN